MRRFFIPAVCVLAALACRRSVLPGRGGDVASEPPFTLSVSLDETFRWGEVALTPPDASTAWTGRAEFRDKGSRSTELLPQDWYRGPGEYALSMNFLRADGSSGSQSVRFRLNGGETRLEGRLSFLSDNPSPQVHLVILEPPLGLHLERMSELSPTGAARYTLIDAREVSGPRFVLFGGIERLEADHWLPIQGSGNCSEAALSALQARDGFTFELREYACLVEPLSPGRYRHLFRVVVPTRDANPSNLVATLRITPLTYEFAVSAEQPAQGPPIGDFPLRGKTRDEGTEED